MLADSRMLQTPDRRHAMCYDHSTQCAFLNNASRGFQDRLAISRTTDVFKTNEMTRGSRC